MRLQVTLTRVRGLTCLVWEHHGSLCSFAAEQVNTRSHCLLTEYEVQYREQGPPKSLDQELTNFSQKKSDNK